MKHLKFSFFNIFSVIAIILVLILILVPFNVVNLEQAQRIAKWLKVYEEINYSFALVKMHEGCIIPDVNEADKVISEEYIVERISPYMNIQEDIKVQAEIPKYSYRMLNRNIVKKNNQFYFNKFLKTKDGMLLSIKENQKNNLMDLEPLYFMFLDINGVEKPNQIGKDVFIINIYKDKINPLGKGRRHASLKVNCSPIGTGLYCAEYYLKGGSF